MDDVFKAGVRPGSPNSQTEIKMLVCFILAKTQQPMTFEQLYEALSEDALVNYFELVQAMEQLEKSGHLICQSQADGVDLYHVTPVGKQAGEELTNALPLSVRERALAAVSRLMERAKRKDELILEIEPTQNGGYQMRFAIPEAGGELISFSLYAPNREQCDLIRRRFLNAPGFIYKGVLALLTGERQVLDEVFPPAEEQLF